MANGAATSNVEQFPGSSRTALLVEELNRILAMLRDSCPRDAVISFDFDGKLQVHIDVRKREDVTAVEAVLPAMGGAGLFHTLTRRPTPNRPFLHRVSALIGNA